jgi:hypothetical protein
VIIATWERLSSAQKQHYQEQAQRIGGTAGAREMFEDGARYVFTHELGHWWQSCRNTSRPYSWGAENGANRIALAFWRERDWGFMQRIVAGFQALARTLPSPVPAGASEEEYFDANFARLAHGEGYVWYQAEMLVTLAAESPPPSFHRALSQPLYPW